MKLHQFGAKRHHLATLTGGEEAVSPKLKNLKQNRSVAFFHSKNRRISSSGNLGKTKCVVSLMRIEAWVSQKSSPEGGERERSTTVIDRRASSHFHTVAMRGKLRLQQTQQAASQTLPCRRPSPSSAVIYVRLAVVIITVLQQYLTPSYHGLTMRAQKKKIASVAWGGGGFKKFALAA